MCEKQLRKTSQKHSSINVGGIGIGGCCGPLAVVGHKGGGPIVVGGGGGGGSSMSHGLGTVSTIAIATSDRVAPSNEIINKVFFFT